MPLMFSPLLQSAEAICSEVSFAGIHDMAGTPPFSCPFSGIAPRLDFGPDMSNTQKLTQLAVMMAITLQTSFLIRLSARRSSW